MEPSSSAAATGGAGCKKDATSAACSAAATSASAADRSTAGAATDGADALTGSIRLAPHRWREGRPRTWQDFVQLAGNDESAAQRQWDNAKPVDMVQLYEEIEENPLDWDFQVAQWHEDDMLAAAQAATVAASMRRECVPLSPHESAAARVLLSVCCCARHRTVLAMTFESQHHPGRSRRLVLAIGAGMWGSWRAGIAVRRAGLTIVRCAWVSGSQTDR